MLIVNKRPIKKDLDEVYNPHITENIKELSSTFTACLTSSSKKEFDSEVVSSPSSPSTTILDEGGREQTLKFCRQSQESTRTTQMCRKGPTRVSAVGTGWLTGNPLVLWVPVLLPLPLPGRVVVLRSRTAVVTRMVRREYIRGQPKTLKKYRRPPPRVSRLHRRRGSIERCRETPMSVGPRKTRERIMSLHTTRVTATVRLRGTKTPLP